MGGPPRILVVEDDRLLRMDVSLVLRREGYDLEVASGAEEAFRLLRDRRFALVLTDVLLPDGCGFDVLQAAKRYDPSTRVVLVTCSHAVDAGGMPDPQGAESILLKPFALADLLATGRRLVTPESRAS